MVSPVTGRQGAVLDSRRNFGEIPTDFGSSPPRTPLTAVPHFPVRRVGAVNVFGRGRL